jgi:hypothetical protein
MEIPKYLLFWCKKEIISASSKQNPIAEKTKYLS